VALPNEFSEMVTYGIEIWRKKKEKRLRWTSEIGSNNSGHTLADISAVTSGNGPNQKCLFSSSAVELILSSLSMMVKMQRISN